MRRLIPALIIGTALSALAENDQSATTIVEHITNGTTVTIELPDELKNRLVPNQNAQDEETQQEQQQAPRPQSGRMPGYRVQVFSDNNPHTAKAEAGSKKRLIDSRFPQYQTYVNYTSPYWRLRVGDFRTQQEANAAAEELRRAFPSYSKEIRVVRDRVNISAN